MKKIIIFTFILVLLQSCGSTNNDNVTSDPNKVISELLKQEDDTNSPPTQDTPIDSLNSLSKQCSLSKPVKILEENVFSNVKFKQVETELSVDITDANRQKTETVKPCNNEIVNTPSLFRNDGFSDIKSTGYSTDTTLYISFEINGHHYFFESIGESSVDTSEVRIVENSVKTNFEDEVPSELSTFNVACQTDYTTSFKTNTLLTDTFQINSYSDKENIDYFIENTDELMDTNYSIIPCNQASETIANNDINYTRRSITFHYYTKSIDQDITIDTPLSAEDHADIISSTILSGFSFSDDTTTYYYQMTPEGITDIQIDEEITLDNYDNNNQKIYDSIVSTIQGVLSQPEENVTYKDLITKFGSQSNTNLVDYNEACNVNKTHSYTTTYLTAPTLTVTSNSSANDTTFMFLSFKNNNDITINFGMYERCKNSDTLTAEEIQNIQIEFYHISENPVESITNQTALSVEDHARFRAKQRLSGIAITHNDQRYYYTTVYEKFGNIDSQINNLISVYTSRYNELVSTGNTTLTGDDIIQAHSTSAF